MKKILPFIVGLLLIGGIAAFFWLNIGGSGGVPVSASLDRGVELFEQKQYPEALSELQALAGDGSEDWRVWYYLGSTRMMLKDYPAAAADLERSLALRPDEPGTLYALGVVYYRLGNLKLAKAYFGAVLDINPNDQHARGLMDIMAKLEQNDAEAEEEPGSDSGGGAAGDT